MTSSIINFIVEKYLSNIVEINPEKTKSSLWSGTFEMSNLKIKREIFETIDLPYCELVNGYIGNLLIKIQLPRFYAYPIRVVIDKVFFHARQKHLDKLNKEDEIKGIENYKNSRLKSVEELKYELSKLKNEAKGEAAGGPGMVSQIINNVKIDINDIVIRFDDEISYPEMPFTFGILMKSLKIRTTNDSFEFNEDDNVNIPYAEINNKRIQLTNLSMFLDTYPKGTKLDFTDKIVDNDKTKIDDDLNEFLGHIRDFYKYCISEVNVHIDDRTAHEYMLYNMGLVLKTALNENTKNGKPKAFAQCDLQEVTTCISIQQIFVLFKLLAYINLNSLYRDGISKDFYTKELSEEEKQDYVYNYIAYYNNKYELNNAKEADKLKELIAPIEEGLKYDIIQGMREAAYLKIDFLKDVKKIEDEIAKEKKSAAGSYFNPLSYFSSGKPTKEQQAKIDELEAKMNEKKQCEEEIEQKMQKLLKAKKSTETDYYPSLPDEFPLYRVDFSMPLCNMSILENKTTSMVDIVYKDFKIKGDLRKKGQFFSLFIDDIKVIQKKLSDSPYQTLMETIPDTASNEDTNDGAINMEFENNPNLEKSNYRFKFRHSKLLILTLNLYSIQYISNRVLAALKSTISQEDIQKYAVGEVSKYINAGFVNKMFNGDYQHFNIDADIKIKSPILLLPQNVCDISNKNCMMLKFGDLKIASILPPRQDFKAHHYESETDINLMYDEYVMKGENFSFVMMTNYEGDIAKANKLNLIEDVSLDFSMKNLIEAKNPNFENMLMSITIHDIQINLRDSQLVYLIDFLVGFSKVSAKLTEDLKKSELPVEEKKNEDKKDVIIDEKTKELNQLKKTKTEKKKEVKETAVTLASEIKQGVLEKKENDKVFFHFKFILTSVVFKIMKTVSQSESAILKSMSSVDMHNKQYKDYLTFSMNSFDFDFKMTNSANMNLAMIIESIDMDDDETSYKSVDDVKGTSIVNPFFKNIISSKPAKKVNDDLFFNPSGEGISMSLVENKKEEIASPFISIGYDYNASMKETAINMSMMHLKIFFNYTTLSRLYQFYLYYIGMLFEKQNQFNTEQKRLKILKSTSSSSVKLDETTVEIKEEAIDINDKEKTITANEKSRMKINFEMKDIEMYMPLDDTVDKTDIMRFNFNMISKITMKNEYMTIHSKALYDLLKMDYTVKDMKISAMIYNIDFDILKLTNNELRQSRLSNKILSNFRINTNLDSFLLVDEKKNVMAIDVKLEPMTMLVGFREIKSLQKFMNASLKFLSDMYLPYDDPIKSYDELSVDTSIKKEVVCKKEEKKESDDDSTSDDEEEVAKDPNVISTSNEQPKPKQKKLSKAEQQKRDKILKDRRIYNICNFNNQMDILFQMDKISMKFLDNTVMLNTPLLNIESNKISMKYISNSNSRDQDNMANAIVESLTRKNIPISDYNVLNLYQYIDMNFNVEINFFNDKVNDWEPIMEPWMGNLKLLQVDRYTKMRIEYTSDDILNFNFSIYSVKVFNSVMKKMYQSEEDWNEESRKQSRMNEKSQGGEDVCLEFINRSGVDVMYKFDADALERKEFIIKDNKENDINGRLTKKRKFTRNEIEAINRQLTDETALLLLKDKISFKIDGYHTVNNIDFSYNHVSSFCLKEIVNNGEVMSRTESIRGGALNIEIVNTNASNQNLLEGEEMIDTSHRQFDIKKDAVSTNSIEVTMIAIMHGLTRKIIFDSNVGFYNNLNTNISILFVSKEKYANKYASNDNNVIPSPEDKTSEPKTLHVIEPKQKFIIPLFFIINDYRVYASINNSKFVLVHEDFKFLQVEKENVIKYEEAINSTDKDKKNFEINDRGSKVLAMSVNDSDYFVSLDMMIHRGTDDVVKSESKLKEEKKKLDKDQAKTTTTGIDNTIKQKERHFKQTAKTYSYYFVFTDCVVIENQLPLNINVNINATSSNQMIDEKDKIALNPLQMKSITKVNPSKDSSTEMTITMKYRENSYNSEAISVKSFDAKNKIITVKMTNANDATDVISVKVKLEDSDIVHGVYNTSYLKLIKNFTKRHHYVIYSDYIVVNKTPIEIIAKGAKEEKEISNHKFAPKAISLFGFDKESIMIKSNESKWSKAFSINTFGMSGVCSLEKEIDSHIVDEKDKDVQLNDIACKISTSSSFKNSTLVIFEERYLLYNRLGFDLFFKQVDAKNNERNFKYTEVKNGEDKMISFIKTAKKMKKMIKISLDERFESSAFTIDDLANFNIKIPIEDTSIIDKINKINEEIEAENKKIMEENEKLKKEEQKQLKNKYFLFTIDNKVNLIVKVSISSYDNGLIYIVIHNPSFTEFSIKNKTDKDVKMMQKDDESEELFVLKAGETTPYIWNDVIQSDKQLLCTIDDVTTVVEFTKIEKTETEINGKKYYFQVVIENKNRTRTLVISTSNSGLKQRRDNIFDILTGKQKTTNMEFIMRLKGMGLSIIDQEPKEVFYISMYTIDLTFNMMSYNKKRIVDTCYKIVLYLKNFQIDYCLEDSFPWIIKPKKQLVPSNEEELISKEGENLSPFVSILICMHTQYNPKTNAYTVNYPQIDFTMQEIDVYIDQFSALTLLKLQGELLSELDFYYAASAKKENNNDEVIELSKIDKNLSLETKSPDDIIKSSENPNMMFINYLMLAAMKINLTLRIDLSAFDVSVLPGFVIKIIASLGNSLARISDSPLRFSEMIHVNVFKDMTEMIWLLISHYQRQGLIEIYKIIGSIDLLGNPVGFVDKIGTGFIEFFNEPRKGFIANNNKSAFVNVGEGLAKGFGSLISNIVGGSFDVVGKITGTLLSATKTITGEKINLREDEEPENIITGIYDGIKGGVIDLGKGITGIFTSPYKRAKAEGVKGFFKGIGSGLLGAIVSPVSAALRIGNSVFVGMKNTANLLAVGKIKTTRFRHPRTIERVIALKPYDAKTAQVQAILRKLEKNDQKILYCNEFTYYEVGYENQKSILILTDVRLLIAYNSKEKVESVFNLKLVQIKDVEVHFEDTDGNKTKDQNENYIMLFTLFDGKKKYIKTDDLTMCCILYSILEKYCKSNR